MNRPLLTTILKAGLLAGTLDILAAFTFVFMSSSRNPLIVLNYIASAMFGADAYSGGVLMQLVGLLFHYLIAFSFTILFFILYPRVQFLRGNITVTAVVYGLFVWCVMNLLVVPASKIPDRPFDIMNAIINMVILMICIGLPLAWMAKKHFATSLAGSKA